MITTGGHAIRLYGMTKKPMTLDEQLVLVCEKLLGWIFGVSYNEFWRKGHETFTKLPPLTLDLVHECEQKLNADQRVQYYYNLLKVITGGYTRTETDFAFLCATAEQRLAALVETIGGMK